MKNFLKFRLELIAWFAVCLIAPVASAQTVAGVKTLAPTSPSESSARVSEAVSPEKGHSTDSERISTLEEALRRQTSEIEQMRKRLSNEGYIAKAAPTMSPRAL